MPFISIQPIRNLHTSDECEQPGSAAVQDDACQTSRNNSHVFLTKNKSAPCDLRLSTRANAQLMLKCACSYLLKVHLARLGVPEKVVMSSCRAASHAAQILGAMLKDPCLVQRLYQNFTKPLKSHV